MKKICLIALLAFAANHAFADEPESGAGSEQSFVMVSMLLSMPDGLRRNSMQIQQLSTDLTDMQRMMLFNSHQTTTACRWLLIFCLDLE